MDALLFAGAVVGALVVITTAVLRAARATAAFIRKVMQFFDDWAGEPARIGHPPVPGVIERLTRIEAQVHPNHGSSLADQLDRLEKTAEYAVALGHENKKHLEELKDAVAARGETE